MLFLGLGNAIGSLSSGYVLQRLGRAPVIVWGLIAVALLYALLPHVPAPAVAYVLLTVVSVLGGTLFPALMGTLQTLSTRLRGTIASLANTTMYAGTFIGTSISGLLYESHGFALVGLLSMLAFLSSQMFFAASGLLKPTDGSLTAGGKNE